MLTRVRRALVAAALPVLLVAPASGATCLAEVCVAVPQDSVRAVLAMVDGGGPPVTGGDGSGVLCLYAKFSGEPPAGWGGDPNSDPPYFWQQTQKWGDQHPNDYDSRACAPACTVPTDGPTGGPCPNSED